MSPERSRWCQRHNLTEARKRTDGREPAIHQRRAIDALNRWYPSATAPRGAILVLPTGAGKTFTTIRFLCLGPLSDDHKVLWLAHTHHLLEQASESFDSGVGWIREPRESLTTRVVSGTIGHFPISEVKASDDVIIATLQTIARAYQASHPALDAFLASTNGRLVIVFDEAHHSPAPSYRRLLTSLRERFPNLYLLGLTATPTHTDETKRGWLVRLFPQRIVHQEEASTLMAQSILARPRVEAPVHTRFRPKFDARDYATWVNTFQDIPEKIIEQLAGSRERNQFIADTYIAHRERYGKTLIFADRWYQCDAICQVLKAANIKADVVYSHTDPGPLTADARNRRTQDYNAKALAAFRRGDLDVLVNVRMLTEGTDVPQTRTVFLTRQTTSQILLTQMVGRALRGPRFGGNAEACIVPFIDDWEHLIHWATYDQLAEGLADDSMPEYGKHPPLQMISIDLVRRLADHMHRGLNVAPAPFLTLLPIGWYRVEFETVVRSTDGSETDDVEQTRRLVLVFENEKEGYERLIQSLGAEDFPNLADARVSLVDAAVSARVNSWVEEFFPAEGSHFGTNLHDDVLAVARHMAQNDGEAPAFFPFAERDNHDVDRLVRAFVEQRLDRLEESRELETEYSSERRLWRVLYSRFDLFASQYDACARRWLEAKRHGADPISYRSMVVTAPENVPEREPSDERQDQAKRRDGRCLCCGEPNRRLWQIDHIRPRYLGGRHDLDNLQTLCKSCNQDKGIREMNFRNMRTMFVQRPEVFQTVELPRERERRDAGGWEKFLRKTVNLYYGCDAVHAVRIGGKGRPYYNWEIELTADNPPEWLQPHMEALLRGIRRARIEVDLQGPESITVVAPEHEPETYRATETTEA